MKTNDLAGIERADGLSPEDAVIVYQLATVRRNKMARNLLRMSYYNDTVGLKNVGLAIPQEMEKKVDTSLGWCAKAVDYLASRSIFDGFTCTDDAVAETIDAIMDANEMPMSYTMAVPSELVHSCGFWTVCPDEERGVVINYHDAITAAALWDYRRKRIKAGLVVEDYRPKSDRCPGNLEPCFAVVHLPDAVIELTRGDKDAWTAVKKPHMVGRPLIEPMCFKPTNARPFGKSRISRACMGITDDMKREIVRTSIHSEMYSSGMKAILGVTEEQYDAIMADKYRAAMTSMFVATRDRDGNVPSIEQFAQQSMEPHIAMMNKLASRMASETNLPTSAFGVDAKVYQSNDSMRASTADLVIEAESLNRTNGKALCNVARMALAITGNKTMAEFMANAPQISVHWQDPSMPSIASISDAVVKLASAVPGFGGTDVFWEKAGYNEDERSRIKSDMGEMGQMAIAAKVFGV